MAINRIVIINLVLLLAACATKPDQQVSLTVHAPEFRNETLLLYTFGVIDAEIDTLTSVKLDSLGRAAFRVDVNKPVFASLLVGKRLGEIYLQPGNAVTVFIPLADTVAISFNGTGKIINNYLATADAIAKRIELRNGYRFMELPEPAAFQELSRQTIDSLQKFHRSYTDSITLSAADEHLLRSRNAVNLFFKREMYKFNYSAMNPKAAFDNQLSSEIPELPDGKYIPLDSALVNPQLAAYGGAIQTYFFTTYFVALDKDTLFRNDPKMLELQPLLVTRLIKRDGHSPALQELLLAKNLDFYLTLSGITPALDSAYTLFKKEYPHSQWHPIIAKRYHKWELLQPGNPAPDFSGVTVSGDTVHLSAFRGKLVFVDVWATWCGPCVAEIPASKSLRQKFATSDKLVFLNFSLDQNAEAWKKKVLSDPEWKDVQLLECNTAWARTLKSKYMIWGIPRYMLIGPDGKIINADSPPPSDPEFQQTLADLVARL